LGVWTSASRSQLAEASCVNEEQKAQQVHLIEFIIFKVAVVTIYI